MMKKLLFSVLLLLMMSIGAVAQETLTVCDGTATNSYVPFNGLYADYGTRSQFVLPAEDLSDMEGGSISQLTFYCSQSSLSFDQEVTVYMKEVDYTTFASATLEDWDGMTAVYTSTIGVSSNQMEITLSTPYTYSGGNLMIGLQVTAWGSSCPSSSWYGVNQSSGNYTAVYNNASSSHVWSSTISRQNFLPKTTFTYTPGAAPTCPRPTELAYSEVVARGAHLSWTNGGSESSWQICLNGDEENLITATTNPFDLTNLTPETAYAVKVRAVCAENDNSNWSNTVSFTTLPSCPVPTALAYADVTTNSVVLSWTAGASETAWQICINNNEDDLVDVTENPYTLTGLTPATTYSIKVRANCGDTDGNSQWTSAVSFTTECEVLTVDADHPYAEGFEDVTGSYAIPTCWERIVEYTSYGSTYPYVYSYGAHNGSKCLYMYSYPYYDTYENIIALPEMNSISTLQISLWAKASSTIPENFEIGYIKNGVFTSVQSFALTTTYQQFTAYLNGAPADAEKIAIRAHHSSSSITVYVDDIEVSPMPTCIAPVDVVVSGITTNAASVSWTDVLPATAWQYQLNDSEIADAESNPINLTGLTANTEYTIKVRTACGEGEYSDWAEGSFTTLCDAITDFPYTESFESTTCPAGCWSIEYAVANPPVNNIMNHVADYAKEGSRSFRFSSYSSTSDYNQYLISPMFDIEGSYVVSFYYRQYSENEHLYFGTSSTGNAVGDFTWTTEEIPAYSATWTLYKTVVPAGTKYFAINYNPQDCRWYAWIDNVVVREVSTAAEILTYSLPTQVSEATIGDGTIEVTVANSTDFDVDLTPTYTISENAEISDPVVTGEGDVRTIAYTVTAEAGNTKDWTVTVTKAPISHDAFITAFTFAGQKEGTTAEISENDTYTVDAVAEWNVDLTAIAPVVTISNAATVAPESGDVQNFTTPVTYTVTAEDGTTTHAYIVTIINDPDACINPSTVSISNITNNSATASWAQAYTETSYLVKVSTEAMTDMTATADVFDGTVEATTKELEGLTANTQYFVYVQSDCENAEDWTSVSFSTPCEAIDLPFNENFDSYSSETQPDCWNVIFTGGDNSNRPRISTSYATSGNCFYIVSGGTSYGANNYIIMPNMNSDYSNVVVEFDSKMESTYSGRLYFGYITDINDASTFVSLETVPSTTSSAHYSYNLVGRTIADNARLAFKWSYSSSWYQVGIDNVVVREISSDAEIVDFNFPTRMAAPVIDNANARVTATASYQADLENLDETVIVSDGAEYVENTANVGGNVKTFTYTVTAEDGTTTKDWTVAVTKAESASTETDIVAFSFVGQVGESAIDTVEHTVTAYAEWDFDLENNDITPTIEVSPMATISNDGEARNFFGSDETPVQYTVTAEDGTTTQIWNVTIVNDPNVCINPDEITVENVTSTGATLSWDKMYQETTYIVKVSTVAYESEEELLAATEFVYNDIVALEGDEATLALTDLTPATYYYVYVQSNCENAESWTVTYFGTECDGSAYSVPFVETFETGSALCWTIIDANNDAEDWGGVYSGAWNIGNFVNGGEAAYIYSGSNDAEDWLISPKIAVVDGAYLTFDYAVDYDYYPEKFSVYVMTDIADYATATVIRETATVTNEEFASIDNIDLSAYAGQEIYIGIKCESEADHDALFIDNFKVILPTYTITATAGENGTIDPESAEVMYGYDKTFTITPVEGYRIATVVVDAETEGEANVTVVAGDGYYTYTFTNVTANHTIHATFEAIPTYTITVNAGENGNVYYNDALVSAPIVVTEGATPEFEITPATGYQIDVLTVGGNTVELTEQQLGGFTYTFEPVMADITLAVTFEAIPAQTYTITVNAGENGTVTYNDEEVTAPVVVNEGDTPAFVITPAENYQIDVLSVDETPVELTPEQLLEGYTYTFAAVEGDHTLTVTFVPVQSADMLEAGSMSIYPNPNNGMFSIDFSNIEGDATYEIINANGAVVETRDINVMNGETMNFNHDLRPGAYFVRIINGDKVYVEQIVVE